MSQSSSPMAARCSDSDPSVRGAGDDPGAQDCLHEQWTHALRVGTFLDETCARSRLPQGEDDACSAAVRQIQVQTGNAEVQALLADLSSQQQIPDLARQFRDRSQRLDVLVNNAGGIRLERHVTGDGLEMTLAVNHMAYFLLTHLLLDTLKAS